MSHARGFTLLELLVAMAIFGLIGVGAYTGLFAVLDAREATRAQSERLAGVQYAVDAMVEDLRQAIDRPVRATRPERRAPLYAPGEGGDPLLAVTRGGRPNPAGLPRSTVARVHWHLAQDGLERSTLARPDATRAVAPPRRRLLERVEAVRFRFLDTDGDWSQRWPALNDTGEPGLPRAVEVTFVLADWGEITRLVAIARGPSPPGEAAAGAGS